MILHYSITYFSINFHLSKLHNHTMLVEAWFLFFYINHGYSSYESMNSHTQVPVCDFANEDQEVLTLIKKYAGGQINLLSCCLQSWLFKYIVLTKHFIADEAVTTSRSRDTSHSRPHEHSHSSHSSHSSSRKKHRHGSRERSSRRSRSRERSKKDKKKKRQVLAIFWSISSFPCYSFLKHCSCS